MGAIACFYFLFCFVTCACACQRNEKDRNEQKVKSEWAIDKTFADIAVNPRPIFVKSPKKFLKYFLIINITNKTLDERYVMCCRWGRKRYCPMARFLLPLRTTLKKEKKFIIVFISDHIFFFLFVPFFPCRMLLSGPFSRQFYFAHNGPKWIKHTFAHLYSSKIMSKLKVSINMNRWKLVIWSCWIFQSFRFNLLPFFDSVFIACDADDDVP